MTQPMRRPFGVGFLSFLITAMGLLQVGGGIVLLLQRNDDDVLSTLDLSSSEVSTAGVVAIIWGVLAVLVAGSLRSGANWARFLVGGLAVINFAVLVWAAVSFDELHWYDILTPTVVYGIVAGYLFFDEDARAFYA